MKKNKVSLLIGVGLISTSLISCSGTNTKSEVEINELKIKLEKNQEEIKGYKKEINEYKEKIEELTKEIELIKANTVAKENRNILEAEYTKADKELNQVWQSIVNYGVDDSEVIENQQEWIKYKESKDLKTKVNLTKERVDTLNKWLSWQRRVQGAYGYQYAQEHECPSLDW